MRAALTRRWSPLLGAAALLFACGPTGSTGDNDNADSHVCGEVCDTADALRCSGATLERCVEHSPDCSDWQVHQRCGDTGQICNDTGATPACMDPESCTDGLHNQDETDVDCGGNLCAPCDVGQGCDGDDDCASGACTGGVCMECRAGSHRCFGNWLRLCNPDETTYTDVQHCDALSGEVCNAAAGVCEPVQPLGNGPANPTGEYYQFAYFTPTNSPFLGGADVDTAPYYIDQNAFENRIYVNRDGQHVDVYRVELLDSDGDGDIEPNQHPDNPDHPGDIEERVLTLVETHSVPIGGTHNNELFVVGDSIFFTRGLAAPGDLFEYDMITATVTTIVDVPTGIWSQVLGYDDVNDLWFSGTPYERWVFSYDPVENEWVLEFQYPNLSGDHADGIEVVTDPKTGTPYIYVSDMTSDYIAQYVRDATGNWQQENLFFYHQAGAAAVEGMGFGAFNHFWCTSEAYESLVHELYEIGGGDIEEYIVD